MKAAIADEMRKIDQIATQTFGIPGVVLMENAGVEIERQIRAVLGEPENKMICVFAGKGKNGGDGFVAARHLHNQGAKVKIFLLGNKQEIIGDAKTNLDIVTRMGIDILEIGGSRDWDKVKFVVTFADCLVDALLGTGFQGEVTGEMAEAVEIINQAGKLVISVDAPSGVDVDNGQVRSVAVKATHTVTFALPKPGLLMFPGADYVGKLTIADIGIPIRLLTDNSIKQNVTTPNSVRELLGRRQSDAHKGTSGRVTVIAGSQGLTGAAALTSMAALKSGAGLVTLGIAESLNDIMEVKLTEVMTKPLPEIAGAAIGREAIPYIEEMSSKCQVVAIGPGLGQQEETMAIVREVFQTIECPMVVDADALQAFVGYTELFSNSNAMAVLTPHPGEMGRLLDMTAEDVNKDRLGTARLAAELWGAIVVLKGARTIVAFPDGEVYINTTGNSGMATGGTGDVLTGVIAGLIAQGLSSHAAAVAGVHIHGLAGDIAAASGMIGLVAGDVLNSLPAAILGIQSN